ncbi:hypothetical protein SESBI_40525 [Sesbania bispinosa]|nr:hypothetical protein SESBI_40525 [Sesbania bispinosa]
MVIISGWADRGNSAKAAHDEVCTFCGGGRVGEIYMITNFGVLRNNGKIREAAHDYKLVFYGSTKVIPYHKISIPLSGFCFIKTSEIKKTNGRLDFLAL